MRSVNCTVMSSATDPKKVFLPELEVLPTDLMLAEFVGEMQELFSPSSYSAPKTMDAPALGQCFNVA